MVDVTRPVNSEDGPQQVFRQRRCVDSVCRFRFVTREEWPGANLVSEPDGLDKWQGQRMAYQNDGRRARRERARKRAQERAPGRPPERPSSPPRF